MEASGSKRFFKVAEILMSEGYLLGPKVGSGSYSKVRLVERITDGKVLCVKIIDTDKAPKDYAEVFMPREVDIVNRLKNDYIVQVYDVFKKESLIFFVMEYAEKGDLLEYLMTNGAPDEGMTRKLFQQIVIAVQYLHKEKFAHRDLKCENILLKKNGDILLTDFGFSRKLDQDNAPCKTFCGSAAYASPELITATPYDPYQNDVWGLGCILFILTSGSMPFDDTNIKQLLKRQQEGVRFPTKVKDKLNPDVKALIAGMLEPDPNKRYTIADIMNDPWYKTGSESENRVTIQLPGVYEWKPSALKF